MSGYVYVMVSEPLGYYKIGQTADHPEKRRRTLNRRLRGFPKWYFDLPRGVQPTREQARVAAPLRLVWYAPTPDPRGAEKALHAMFWHRRVDRRKRRTALDWFALTDEDIETIRAMGQGEIIVL